MKTIPSPFVEIGKKEVKVVIGMPCQDLMMARTGHSIVRAVMNDPTVIDFLMWQGCEIAGARTWLVKEEIRKGGTHLLFID